MTEKRRKRTAVKISVIVLVCLLLIASLGLNIYYLFFFDISYLQSTDEIYIMESGILKNNLEFADGEDFVFKYDFTHEDYSQLKEKYDIGQIAGGGTEFE